jgi:hypothetical protein
MPLLNINRDKFALMSVEELFSVSDTDTVWDAWLTAVNLVDLLEHMDGIAGHYDFAEARSKIAKIYSIAEYHSIDKANIACQCGLSDAEHALLKRKILTFFRLQVTNLKHFVY